MTSLSASDRQVELEARAVQLSSVDLKACTNLREAFGSADQWQLAVGPHRFMLIPFLREWWYYDAAHKEWRFTGKRPGEVRFVFEGGRLELRAPATEAPVSPKPENDTATHGAVRRFCPSCGAQTSLNWKFCQACGEKIPRTV